MTQLADPVFLLAAARRAVELAVRLLHAHPPGRLTSKGDRDMASEMDYLVERTLRQYLRDETPDIGFHGEEDGGTDLATETVWVLDPVDGTANFVHGIPLCAVSLGLVHKGLPQLGVIAMPYLGEQYWAVRGGGAFSTERQLAVSGTTRLPDAIVALGDYAVGTGAEHDNQLRLALTGQLAANVQRVRMVGSAAIDLAWLAAGRFDACVALSNKPWDTAAGVVIAAEAGALVVDHDGSPHALDSTATIAANPLLIPHLTALVTEARHHVAGAPSAGLG
jgi:myo-inositol-1(or 4)-monophosphatase